MFLNSKLSRVLWAGALLALPVHAHAVRVVTTVAPVTSMWRTWPEAARG